MDQLYAKYTNKSYYIKNDLIKMPKYGKKQHLKRISCSIGKMYMIHYQKMLKSYAYYSILLCLIENMSERS